MIRSPAFTQNTLREGFVELAFGEPDPSLLPLGLVRDAAARALAVDVAALAYGPNAGPGAPRSAIAERSARREGLPMTPNEVLISAGNSQALSQVMTLLTRPGDVVFVENPTYNLALGIIADHPVEVRGVPMDEDGLRVDALAELIHGARTTGRRPRLLYTIPTFHNPTGVCLSTPRRAALAELARREDLIVVEDDVYRELVYENEAPPALRTFDPEAPLLRLGSFSKSLAPGLRLGWIDGPAPLLEQLASDGVLESGGCMSQVPAHVVAALFQAHAYDTHAAMVRLAYAARRDALAAALTEHLPPGCRFRVPGGGFFIWITLPSGLSATALLPAAERHAVGYSPGRRFSTSGDDGSLRLAFSLYDEAALAEAGRRLGAAVADGA